LHNNCLPCKNGDIAHIKAIQRFYPTYYQESMKLSDDLKLYWGRDKDAFYNEFGRELGQDIACHNCKW
jgi:hypothetical protein